MSLGLQLFTCLHRFGRMRLPEQLGMLPRSEHMILEMLIESEGKAKKELSTAALAKRMHISPPAVSRTVRTLRERGLIGAEPDPADRRNLRIHVTAAGHAVIASDRVLLDALLDRAAARLDPGEVDRFIQTFERLSAAVADELAAQKAQNS